MKKYLCLVLAVIFIFVFASCTKKPTEQPVIDNTDTSDNVSDNNDSSGEQTDGDNDQEVIERFIFDEMDQANGIYEMVDLFTEYMSEKYNSYSLVNSSYEQSNPGLVYMTNKRFSVTDGIYTEENAFTSLCFMNSKDFSRGIMNQDQIIDEFGKSWDDLLAVNKMSKELEDETRITEMHLVPYELTTFCSYYGDGEVSIYCNPTDDGYEIRTNIDEPYYKREITCTFTEDNIFEVERAVSGDITYIYSRNIKFFNVTLDEMTYRAHVYEQAKTREELKETLGIFLFDPEFDAKG